MSPQLSTSNSMESARCEYERSRHDGWYKQFSKCLRTELPRRRQSRMTLHRRRIQAMTSLTLADVSTASDAEVAAASARKKLQTTASLKPSEWTLISLPSHRRDTSFVVRETTGHTKRPKSPLVRRECQWSLLHSV